MRRTGKKGVEERKGKRKNRHIKKQEAEQKDKDESIQYSDKISDYLFHEVKCNKKQEEEKIRKKDNNR